MFFKKEFFLFLVFFFLSSCLLEIGEKAPPIPKYRVVPDSSYCSKLNYREEFSAYFLKAEKEPLKMSTGERIKKALRCLGSVISRNKNLFKNEQFAKQELINLLNQDFVKTDNAQPIIDHIISPEYFDHYIFFKNNIVYLIEQHRNNQAVSADQVCQSEEGDKVVFSKQDVDSFLDFLKNLEDFFLTIEKNSYEIFNDFFKKNSSDPYLSSKSNLGRSLVFRAQFLHFLSLYMKEDFPEYSQYLKDKLSEGIYNFAQLEERNNIPYGERDDLEELFQNKRNLQKMFQVGNDILAPMLSMAQWPPSQSDKLGAQNVKYILLNIYIMKTLFSVYDVDKDSELSPEELKPLKCLITPLVSIIISSKLKDQWDIVKEIYDSQYIADYIIQSQEIPYSEYDMGFLMYRVSRAAGWGEAEALSYIEISRLVSALFAAFFDIKFTEFFDDSESVENASSP